MLISESWERLDEPLSNAIDIEGFEVISNPYQRKNVGGKPALIVNTKKFNVINPNQTMINIPWGVEIVWAIITPKGVSNSSIIKRIVVASFYSKPGSRKKTLLLDHISEVYHLLSAKYSDGLYWIVGGDKNDLKVKAIIGLNQNFKQLVQVPTRLSPPAILDVIITDLSKWYQNPICESSLDVDPNKPGSPSDHQMVIMEPLNAFHNKKERKKKTFQFRSFSDAAFEAMEKELNVVDWSEVLDDVPNHDKMQIFHHKLYSLFDKCFPLKTRTVFNESQPYFTDKKELNNAKKLFYRKKVSRLRTSNSRQWFRNIKQLINPDEGDAVLEVDDIKNFSDDQQAEIIADRFAEVSNEYDPLDREKIHFPKFSNSEIPIFTEIEVLEVLNDLDTSKSTRNTDIPARILKRFAMRIHKPLTLLINIAVQQGVWPDFLKLDLFKTCT